MSLQRGKMLANLAISANTKKNVSDAQNKKNISMAEELESFVHTTCTISSENVSNIDPGPSTSSGGFGQICEENISDFSEDDSFKDPNYEHEATDNSKTSSEWDQTEEVQSESTNLDGLKKRVCKKNRQINRNAGKAYVTLKGKSKKAKSLHPLTNCRAMCKNRLTEESRQKIFNEYWNLGNYDKRAAFVSSMMIVVDTATHRPRALGNNKTRSKTYNYFLEVNGSRVNVCRGCFLKTLDESDNMTKFIGKKKIMTTSGLVSSDNRGKREPRNKHCNEKLAEVKAHILSFPSYESHYTRKENDKRYLSSDLTMSKMYDLYRSTINNPVGSYTYYEQFHKLKLTFKKRKLDTCYTCDKYKMKLELATTLEEKTEIECCRIKHHTAAELAYQEKKIDKEYSKKNEYFKCLTFDLQQCLPTPSLTSSIAFYKRQLWTFNLTIHDNGSGKSEHCMWYESISGRGANQVASCLYQYLKKLQSNVKHVVLYSDTCGGQNKNSHLAAMFTFLINEKSTSIEVIDHKFMVPGHSHMEVDVDHGVIEKKKKKRNIEIFHPHDWMQLVRSSSEKFTVFEMNSQIFLNFANLLKSRGPLVLRKKSCSGDLFKWHDVQWLRYSIDKDIGEILYKLSLERDTQFQLIDLKRRGAKSPFAVNPITDQLIPISKEKKRDILSLFHLIPQIFHNFYQNLPDANAGSNNDPDLEELDDDV